MDNKKRKIQMEGYSRWDLADRRGTLAMGTGSGKSWIFLHALEEAYKVHGDELRAAIMVPTEVLRDSNWPAEAKVWGLGDLFEKHVQGICYASATKIKNQHFHLLGFDEIHWITERSSVIFEDNIIDTIMGLTATAPPTGEKALILAQYAPVCFTYSLDDGVRDGLIADFDIYLMLVQLDDKDKYIKAGSKAKPFLTTEKGQYEYLTKVLKKLLYAPIKDEESIKWAMLARARFIYNIRSKTQVAEKLISRITPDKRVLVFCGTIAQAEHLLPGRTYHSKTTTTQLESFMDGGINILGVVNALNEGMNIPDLDIGVIVQLSSNERNLVQRLGRIVRVRDDYKAKLFVIVVEGTVDEDWAKNALQAVDPSHIHYISAKNL